MTIRTIPQLRVQFAGIPKIGAHDELDLLDTLEALTNATVTPNIRTASYTFALADIAQMVLMNVTTTANNLTVPPNSSVPLPLGQVLSFAQIGTGVTTLVAGAGVTFLNASSNVLRAQGSPGSAYQYAANNWLIWGDFV